MTQELEVKFDNLEVMLPEDDVYPIATQEISAVRDKIRLLTRTISESYWDLSLLIKRVSSERLFRTWGYSTFDEWSAHELGFSRRKVYYLLQFANYCQVRLPQAIPNMPELVYEIRQLGWTKACKLAIEDVITKENCDAVIQAAKKPMSEFNDYLDTLKRLNPDLKKEKETLVRHIRITSEQNKIVNRAFTKARAIAGRRDLTDGQVLELICAEFDAANEMDLPSYLSRVERVFGCDLIALIRNKVAYGIDTLENLANYLEQKKQME